MQKKQSVVTMNFRPLLAAALASAVTFAAAAEPAKRAVSLDECIRLALQKNLDIRISRFAPELTQLSLEATYGAYDPEFSFGAQRNFDKSPGQQISTGVFSNPVDQERESFNTSLGGILPTGTRYSLAGNVTRNNSDRLAGTNRLGAVDYYGGGAATLTQPLLKNFWIDATRLSIQLTRKSLKQDELTVRAQIIATVTDVQVAYYNLASSREAVSVQEKALELADRSLAENKKRVEVGAMAPLEEKQAEAQVAASKADLLDARQNYSIALNTLKALISDDFASFEEVLDPSEKLVPVAYPFSKQESWHKALTMRPDILRKQIDLEKQAITLRYRKNQLFPQLDLNASYSLSGRAGRVGGVGDGVGDYFAQIRDQDSPSHGYGAVLRIPLSNRTERRNFQAAKLSKESLLLDLKRTEQQIMVSVDNAILTAQTAFERVEATKQARGYAEQALDAEQKKLENGKSTSFVVLRLQRDLTQARSNEIRAISDYYRSLALLHEAEGATLESAGVKLEIR